MTTAFAGVALALPVIRDLGVHAELSQAGLYQLLLALVGRTYQPLAWGDTALTWLAGLPEREAEQARTAAVTWPDATLWAEPAELTQAVEQAGEHFGASPGSVVTLLILRRFARGLRGFASSSPGYLASHFLNLPGQLHVSDDAVEVLLSRAPLGVVLQMAGRDGEQGEIPWLNGRRLVIQLPEG